MLSKKYKALKFIHSLSKLNTILSTSPIVCFIDAKCLIGKDIISLKKCICPLGFKMFVINNAFLRLSDQLLKLYKYRNLWINLNSGNVVMFYCDNVLSIPSISKLVNSHVFFEKFSLSALIFYFEKRFFYANDLINILKASKEEAFRKLICLLTCFSHSLTNNITSFIKQSLIQIGFKKLNA